MIKREFKNIMEYDENNSRFFKLIKKRSTGLIDNGIFKHNLDDLSFNHLNHTTMKYTKKASNLI